MTSVKKELFNGKQRAVVLFALLVLSIIQLNAQGTGSGGFATNPFSSPATTSTTTNGSSSVRVGVMDPGGGNGLPGGSDIPLDSGLSLLIVIAIGSAYKQSCKRKQTHQLA